MLTTMLMLTCTKKPFKKVTNSSYFYSEAMISYISNIYVIDMG